MTVSPRGTGYRARKGNWKREWRMGADERGISVPLGREILFGYGGRIAVVLSDRRARRDRRRFFADGDGGYVKDWTPI